MPGMADQDQRAALADVTLALVVHLGDERAGRVEDREAAHRCFLLDALRDTVRREHRDGIRRNLGDFFDEHRTFGFETLDHVLVVHDLVAHVDGWAVLLQRALDDLDRAHHTGAKSAGLGQYHLHDQALLVSSKRLKVQINLCARVSRASRVP